MVEHFYAKFGGPSCIGFWDMVREKNDERQRNPYRRRG